MATPLQPRPPPRNTKTKTTHHGHGSRSLRTSSAAIRDVTSCQSIPILLPVSRQGWRRNSPGTSVLYPLDCYPCLRRIGDDLDALHRQVLAMVKEGKNGKVLKKLKDRKEALLTALSVVVDKDDQALLRVTALEEVSQDGFDVVRSRIDEALGTIHREWLSMVQQGRNGKARKKLNDRKEALLTARALVGIFHKAGKALEGYIQTHSQVPYDEIVEHVSSILSSSGIIPVGKGIDTANLECYQYDGIILTDKSGSQRVDYGETDEDDKSSSLKDEVSKRPQERKMICCALISNQSECHQFSFNFAC